MNRRPKLVDFCLQVPASRAQLGGVISSGHNNNVCEICDQNVQDRDRYLTHLQLFHKQMRGKTSADMQQASNHFVN